MRYRIAHDAVAIYAVIGHDKPANRAIDKRCALRAKTTYLNAAFFIIGTSSIVVLMQYYYSAIQRAACNA